MTANDIVENILQRLRQAWSQALTWLNGLYTLVLLFILQHPDVNEKIMPFVPEDWRPLASLLLPLLTFWAVQQAKEIDRTRLLARTKSTEPES